MSFTFYSIIFLFYVVHSSARLPTYSYTEEPNERIDEGSINVALFFAASDDSDNFKDASGCNALNFTKVADIEPTPSKKDIDKEIRGIPATCDDLFESSLMSLISFARVVKGMSAAIATTSNTTGFSSMSEINKHHSLPLRKVMIPQEPDSMSFPKQDESYKVNLIKQPGMPDLEQIDTGAIPIYNMYPEEKSLKWPRHTRRSLLVKSEDTQFFDISSPENDKEERDRDIADIPALQQQDKPKSFWDIIGIMSSIRNSFFNDFFLPEIDRSRKMLDDEIGLDLSKLGRIQEPSYFELVQTSLKNVKANGDEFILVVIGGNLNEISDPYSNLLQSAKYVEETSKNTLIIITGTCFNQSTSERNSKSIPVYAKGPNMNVLQGAKSLFDLPKFVMKAMTQQVKERQSGSNQTSHKIKRDKRDTATFSSREFGLFDGPGALPINSTAIAEHSKSFPLLFPYSVTFFYVLYF